MLTSVLATCALLLLGASAAAQTPGNASPAAPLVCASIPGADPALAHVNFDISWDELAKYALTSPESIRAWERAQGY